MEGKFSIDQWCVDTAACEISRAGSTHKLSPRAVAVLAQLASRVGDVVTFDEFLSAHWARSVTSANAVHKVVAELRNALGSDANYIETIPKRGYRLMARTGRIEHANGTEHPEKRTPRLQAGHPPVVAPRVRSAAEPLRAKRSHYTDDSAVPAAEPPAAFVWRGQSGEYSDVVVVDAGDRSAVLLPPTVSGADITPASFTTIRDQVVGRLQTGLGATRRQGGGRDPSVRPLNPYYIVTVHIDADGDEFHAEFVFEPATNDLPLYHGRVDVPERDVAALVGRVVVQLSDDLTVLLDPARTQEMREWGTQNVHAYRLARKADSYQLIQNVESLPRAELLFREALAHDPHFPYAYESLASTYWAMWQTPTNDAMVERIRRDLQALSRDAKTALTDQRVIASVERTYRFVCITTAFDAAAYWSDALREDPRSIEALRQFSRFLTGARLLNESEGYVEKAIDLAKSIGEPGWVRALETEYPTYAGIRGDFDHQIAQMKENVDGTNPDFTLSLYGLVQTLAHLGRFREASVYLARLKASDPAWGSAAELILAAHRGDFPPASEQLREALANPDLTNAIRGIACFVVGDIECGINYWRDIEQAFLPLQWQFLPSTEAYFAAGVTQDARYQALREELGIGKKWREYMRAKASELTPVTGIEVTTPAA